MTATQLKVMVAFTGAWVVLGWGIVVWEQGSGDGGAGIIAADLVDRGAGGRGGSVAEEDVGIAKPGRLQRPERQKRFLPSHQQRQL